MENYGYGWRARIGMVYPAVVAEIFLTEFFTIVPRGVTLSLTNLVIQSLTSKKGLEESIPLIYERAEWLAKRKVDVIVVGGTPMFHLMGVGSDRDMIDKLEKKFGVPVTTTLTAPIEAFKKLGVKKIAVASPYFEDQNVKVKKFLEGSGFEVVNIKGISAEIEVTHALPLETSYRHARRVFYEKPGAEAVYIPCAQFAVPYLQELENDIKVPVVNAVVSTIWHCFDLLKIQEPIRGHGRLLSLLGESAS